MPWSSSESERRIPDLLPSARVAEHPFRSRAESFFEFAMRRSNEIREQFLDRAPRDEPTGSTERQRPSVHR